jgi:hypothetical protein
MKFPEKEELSTTPIRSSPSNSSRFSYRPDWIMSPHHLDHSNFFASLSPSVDSQTVHSQCDSQLRLSSSRTQSSVPFSTSIRTSRSSATEFAVRQDLCNKRHQRAFSAPPKIKHLSSPRSEEFAKRKEKRLSSGRVIEESTKKGSQREWKIETEKARKEGV